MKRKCKKILSGVGVFINLVCKLLILVVSLVLCATGEVEKGIYYILLYIACILVSEFTKEK